MPGTEATHRKARPRISENHIQETVVEYLQWDGWRAFRTELTVQREYGRVVGEAGQPDYLFMRYRATFRNLVAQDIRISTDYSVSQILWIEFKAPGKSPRPDQLAWHKSERERGALVLVVDDIDAFIQWYESSGLLRRR